MRVILTETVTNLGHIGDLVTVKNGYARNFLLPRKFAVIANEGNQSSFKHQMALLAKKRQGSLLAAKALGEKISKVSINVTKQVGEDERIFGTVTTAELAEGLTAEGFHISKKDITITSEIKKVGVYQAEAKIHPEVTATFKVWVVSA